MCLQYLTWIPYNIQINISSDFYKFDDDLSTNFGLFESFTVLIEIANLPWWNFEIFRKNDYYILGHVGHVQYDFLSSEIWPKILSKFLKRPKGE